MPERRRPVMRLEASLFLVLAGALFASRMIPVWSTVMESAPNEDEPPSLLGFDSYYHLRHASFAGTNLRLQRWDDGTHFPTGERSSTGLFDLAIGLVARLCAGGKVPSMKEVGTVLAWSSPVLMLVGLLLLFLLARPSNGLLACLLLVLFPGELLERSLLGNGNHHAAEVVLTLFTCLGIVSLFRRPANDDGWGATFRRPAFVAALPMTLFLYTWVGAPLVIGLVALGFIALALLEIIRGEDAQRLSRVSMRWSLGVILPGSVLAALVPDLVLSPGLLFGGGAALLALPLLLEGLRKSAELVARLGFGPPVAAGALVAQVALLGWVGLFFLPEPLALELLGPKTPYVSEHIPVTLRRAFELYGALGFLALCALPLTLTSRPFQRERVFLTVFGCGLIGLWGRTYDYGYATAPFVALLGTFAGQAVLERIPRPLPRRLVGAALLLLVVVPLWPARQVRLPWPDQKGVAQLETVTSGWRHALTWMRTQTPKPERGYGVMVSWEMGNAVAALGERPPVWSQGVPPPSLSNWFLILEEENALATIHPEVRYAVVDARTLGPGFMTRVIASSRRESDYIEAQTDPALLSYGYAYSHSMAGRMYLQDGTELAHFRLVYETPNMSALWYEVQPVRHAGRLGYRVRRRAKVDLTESETAKLASLHKKVEIHPSIKIFERVRGARLRGRGTPGAIVKARLDLRSITGRTIRYTRTATIALGDGSFELRVAHHTQPSSQLEPIGVYALFQRTKDAQKESPLGTVRVTERDVRSDNIVAIQPVAP